MSAANIAAVNTAWRRHCEREAASQNSAVDSLPSDDAAYQGAPLVVLLLASLCAVEPGALLEGDIINDLISSCAAMVDRMAERGRDGYATPGELREVVTRLDIVRELRRRERQHDGDMEQTNPGGAP